MQERGILSGEKSSEKYVGDFRGGIQQAGILQHTCLVFVRSTFSTNCLPYCSKDSREIILVQIKTFKYTVYTARVADVEGAQERRSTKGQGLLRKEGPPTYAILSRNSVLSRFTRFLKGFHRAFNESHPAFIKLSKKAILLPKSFQRNPSRLRRAFNKSHLAFVELPLWWQ